MTSVYAGALSDLFNALSLPNLRALAVAHGVRALPHEESKAFDEQRAEYLALIPSLEVAVDHTYEDMTMVGRS
ncbi:hypothetical protein F4604DRAFT_1925457 [Suillus subluteus]|nr:hypothetical protein F4604DRAFT_1925457 [Suillus subluteus]